MIPTPLIAANQRGPSSAARFRVQAVRTAPIRRHGRGKPGTPEGRSLPGSKQESACAHRSPILGDIALLPTPFQLPRLLQSGGILLGHRMGDVPSAAYRIEGPVAVEDQDRHGPQNTGRQDQGASHADSHVEVRSPNWPRHRFGLHCPGDPVNRLTASATLPGIHDPTIAVDRRCSSCRRLRQPTATSTTGRYPMGWTRRVQGIAGRSSGG